MCQKIVLKNVFVIIAFLIGSTYPIFYYRFVVREIGGAFVMGKIPIDIDIVEQRFLSL